MRAMILLAATLVSGSVLAEASPAEAAPAGATETSVPADRMGATTRSWTALQASGTAASREARPLPGEAATQAFERYSNSFKHPIPEKFERESFATKQQ